MDKKILFGKNLRFLRKNRGLDQGQMGEVFSVKNTAWSNYEKGLSFPDVSTLMAMSKYFGISESDLLHQDLESKKDLMVLEDPKVLYNGSLDKRLSEVERRLEALEKSRSGAAKN